MTDNRPDPSRLMDIGMGFWPAKTLLSAVELDLFSQLGAGSMSGDEIGDRLGLHPRGIYDFLDALVALKILERDGDGTAGRYRNGVEAAAFLDKTSPTYAGGFLEMANARLYRFWGDLTEALRTGRPQNEIKLTGKPMFAELYRDPARLEQFLNAMSAVSAGPFQELAERVDFARYRTLCDVGGANGQLCMTIARRHPHLQCTTFDLPEVGSVAEKVIDAAGLSGRIAVASGDFFADPFPRADDDAGTLTVNNGGSVYDLTAFTVDNGGTLTVDNGGVLTDYGALTVNSGGTLIDGGNLTVNTSATLTDSGSLTVGPSGALNDYGTVTVSPGVTLTDAGNVSVYSGGLLTDNGALTVQNGGVVTVYSGGTLNDAGALTFEQGTLNDYGTLTVSNGGALTVDSGGVVYDVDGTLTLNTGTLNITSGGVVSLQDAGILTVSHGSTLFVNNGAYLLVHSGTTVLVDPGGTLAIGPGEIVTIGPGGSQGASGLVGQVFVTPGTAAQPGLLSTAASPGLSGLSGLSGIHGSDGDVRLDDDLSNVLWDTMSVIAD